ncbi:hypothetical protein EZ428_08485 [Pedobacter frigiditerrae]|uniref:Uncharacterized protein n=1 Tax=Pedobacter frigiditerrae TaxID=2530452 RepID=A0A4R0MWY2_9SPHI|nr:hypothetical protein [Pedobacter frigiditerrae]TCC91779.1 hypothetical protein EZ428_08485 [Pedobacter frigiditerrae]
MGKKRKSKGKKVRYILVRSKAYGDHYRAVRGSYTEIFLADGMKESTAKQTTANLMAKIIFDAVNDLAPGFKDTVFWSKLLQKIRAQQKEGKLISYLPLEKMEMRPNYRTNKHGYFYIKPQYPGPNMVLDYTLYGPATDRAYLMSILRIATDETLLNAYPAEVLTAQLSGELQKGEVLLRFSELPANAQCLYVLKCEKLKDGKVVGTLARMGVAFLRKIG